MKGVISYIEKGSFQGKDGNAVTFHSVIVDGIKYTCYNKSISEKKIGDEVEFESVPKGEGKPPQMKLAGEAQGGFKKEWKPQDPDSMYRCNAMTNAVAFFDGSNIEGLISTYNAIYKAMKGEPAPVSTPAVTNTQSVANQQSPQMPETYPKKSSEGKVLATDSQKNAIKNMCKARKMSIDDFLTESLGYGCPHEELSKAEGSMAIGYWNKKDEASEPF